MIVVGFRPRSPQPVPELEPAGSAATLAHMKAKPTASAAQIQPPEYPKRITPESLARYKGAMRAYDARRLAAGVPAEQIQCENSFFPPMVTARVIRRCTAPAVVLQLIAEAESNAA
jgi:hypothetical protein